MPYLIDSDLVIDHLAEDPAALRLLDRLAPGGLTISIITYMEVYQGTIVSPDPTQAQAKLDVFIAAVPIVPLSVMVARRCARLRVELQWQGKRVRSRALDLLNAATALEHELTLVTRNRADYEDIPDLAILTIGQLGS
jgi:tRNA(fMet)-specific endonuclease VapC